MGLFTYPHVEPLPAGISFAGKNVVITGANGEVDLELARQMLALNAQNVILAVYNPRNGEADKASLLEDEAVKSLPNSPTVTVMHLDMCNFDSVKSFAAALKTRLFFLDFLVLDVASSSLETGRIITN